MAKHPVASLTLPYFPRIVNNQVKVHPRGSVIEPRSELLLTRIIAGYQWRGLPSHFSRAHIFPATLSLHITSRWLEHRLCPAWNEREICFCRFCSRFGLRFVHSAAETSVLKTGLYFLWGPLFTRSAVAPRLRAARSAGAPLLTEYLHIKVLLHEPVSERIPQRQEAVSE